MKSKNSSKTTTGAILVVAFFLGALGTLFTIADWSLAKKIIALFVTSIILLILEILDRKQKNNSVAKKNLPRLLDLFVEVQKDLDPKLKNIYRKEIVFQIFKTASIIIILMIIVAIVFNFAVEKIDLALNPPTPTPIPTKTLTLTPSATIIPEADTLYYLFLLDASARMKANFNGSESKWSSIQNSALNHLIYGLPPRANYGLIVLGGNLSGSTRGCGDKNQAAVTLGLNTQGTLIDTIKNLNSEGVASLGDAINLSRNIFEQKQGNIQKKLFMFLGGGDDCFDDKWTALKYFLKDYKNSTSIDVATEVVILADESIDPDLAAKLAELQSDITRLGLKDQVNLAAPENNNDLQVVVANIYDQTIVQARQYEPAAVNAQQAFNVVRTMLPIQTATTSLQSAQTSVASVPVTNPPSIIIVQAPVIATPAPTFTRTITPSPVPSTNTTEPIQWDSTSSDGGYGAKKIYFSSKDVHYQVFNVSTNGLIFTTAAKYQNENDVKAGTFSSDSTRFAAAYHYDNNGQYTWIGVWNAQSGTYLGCVEKTEWTTDLSGVFDVPLSTQACVSL